MSHSFLPRPSLAERLLAHRQDPVPSLCQARPDVPDRLDQIFQQMMAKSPAQRLDSAVALVAALEAAGLAPTQAADQLAAADVKVYCFGSTVMNWAKRVTDPFDITLQEVRRCLPRMRRLGTIEETADQWAFLASIRPMSPVRK